MRNIRTFARHNYAEDALKYRRHFNDRSDYVSVMIMKRGLGLVISQKKVKQPSVNIRCRKRQLALLIAAHNEEMVIGQTLRSAIKAGMKPENIYVVDDYSTDATSRIAKSIIGSKNVLKVSRSGKGLALTKATKKFALCDRYAWIHIADADGGFATDYFVIFRKSLRIKYAAATGYVRSLPGNSVSQYRVVEYTLGMELHRRFQALTHTITVIPGPTSCFRSDVFRKVNFANKSLTEDFDVTLQLHRQNLGRIQFIPQAVAYTQDPRNLHDYTKQITRWNRGVMQGIKRHGMGKKLTRVDSYLMYQLSQNFLLFASFFIFLPWFMITRHSMYALANAFLYDVTLLFILTLLTAGKARRGDVLSAFPQIYFYRWVALGVFLKAFVEVMILKRFKATEGLWGTSGRRYRSAI